MGSQSSVSRMLGSNCRLSVSAPWLLRHGGGHRMAGGLAGAPPWLVPVGAMFQAIGIDGLLLGLLLTASAAAHASHCAAGDASVSSASVSADLCAFLYGGACGAQYAHGAMAARLEAVGSLATGSARAGEVLRMAEVAIYWPTPRLA